MTAYFESKNVNDEKVVAHETTSSNTQHTRLHTYPKAFVGNGFNINELKDGLEGRIGRLSFRPHHGKDGSMSQRHDSKRRERDHVCE
jgi:hypothetical protein